MPGPLVLKIHSFTKKWKLITIKHMHIQEWGYNNEKEFVKDAMISPKKREEFKQFNIPLIEGVVEIYVEQYHLESNISSILKTIGLQSFDAAFNNYIQLTNAYGNKSFLFSTYFVTPLRMVIEEFLGINESTKL